jgi:hypothetical protein
MTHPLRVPAETVTAERDLEEAWWMWQALGHAQVAKHASLVEHHLYVAASSFYHLSDDARDRLRDALTAGRNAARLRCERLTLEKRIANARDVLARCQAEVDRLKPKRELLQRSFEYAWDELQRWSLLVAELETSSLKLEVLP